MGPTGHPDHANRVARQRRLAGVAALMTILLIAPLALSAQVAGDRAQNSLSVRVRGSASSTAPADDATARVDLRAAPRYRLGAGDVIDIFVWRNPDLSRRVPVRPDGRISLPLAGELLAAGRTALELRAEISARLADYIQVPDITVSVAEIKSLVVYVLGSVAKPGPLVLQSDVNVLQAIAMAGGLSEFADKNGITVMRSENGKQVLLEFRYSDVVKGERPEMNITLHAGDIIHVP